MKALCKLHNKPGIWLTEEDKPVHGYNDVLIRITRAAICGTDVHIYKWDDWASKTIPVPMVIGHEFAGVIEAIGDGVKGYKVGDRVSGEGHITCGHCRNCRAGKRHLCRNTVGVGVNRSGAFAEYLVMPADNVFKLSGQISDDVGAILDPLGNAVHTALSFDMVGEDVLITGAGPIGIMATAIAKHVGARYVVVSDINEYRLGLAKAMGADSVIHPQKTDLLEVMHQLGIVEGFDVGLEMSGNASAFSTMLERMNHGGKIGILGIPPDKVGIDWNQVIFKGLVLKGIYGREMYETWYKMASMLQSGLDVSPVITHHYDVDQYEEAFEMALSGKAGKVILNWS